ncbi:hypothetical protein ANO11243_096170 [Dothideomycetidae sp. 11243]|nr:hypothetical protein ANO11243_096170 [fungal sp. No.11243]
MSMALSHKDRLLLVGQALQYHHKDLRLLEKAFIARGAEGTVEIVDGNGKKTYKIVDQDKYDGNRRLVQVGQSVVQLVTTQTGQKSLFLPSTPIERLTQRAQSLEFYDLIKLNPRQRGVVSPVTLRSVYRAIVGAVWEDSGKDYEIAQQVVHRL